MNTINVNVDTRDCRDQADLGAKLGAAVEKEIAAHPDKECAVVEIIRRADGGATAILAVNERQLCKTCHHMIGGSDTIGHWQCDKRVDAVTGQFVLCTDERAGRSIGFPSTTPLCGPEGCNWAAPPEEQKANN